MPKNDQMFDIETLKNDPTMWSRLSTPLKDSKVLDRVFDGHENPFQRDEKAAEEKIRKLAAEGNLYLREMGKSNDFRRLNMKAGELELGKKHTMERGIYYSDPFIGILGRISRSYFRWIGLERVSGWFGTWLRNREDKLNRNKKHRNEYKAVIAKSKVLRAKEKKEIKLLKQHEKNLEILEKAKLEAEKTQRELDKLQYGDVPKEREQTPTPPTQPPQTEQKDQSKEQTLQQTPPQQQTPVQQQPPIQQQPPVQQQPPIQQQTPPQPQTLVQTHAVQEEIVGTKQEAVPGLQDKNSLAEMLNGMLQNQQDVNKLMEDVKAAMQTLQQFMAQMNPTEQQMQQDQQPEVKEVAEKGEMPTILTQPPQPEPDKVSIQGRPKEQEVQPPHERLAAEKQRVEGVKNWRQTITNALFSHEDGREMREYLHSLREDATHHSTALSCIAFGVVRGASADQENKQSVMDALLNGQSIGRQNNGLINKSMDEYNYAAEQLQVNNREPMEKMLTEAVMALSYQASRESSLSPRHTMIARLISNAFRIADSNGLNLPLSNDERTFVKGAQELGKLAQKYQAAREYLSKDTKDLNSPEGRNAVCDLLAGNTVEKMLRDEQQNPKAFSDVQILMGDGAWSVKNIRAMISTSETRRAIGLDHIQAILEKPNSFKAAYVAKDIKNEMLSETMAAMTDPERTAQKQMERTQELEQANVNRMQGLV